MKAHRPKQADWNKPFRIINKREDFLRLEGGDQELIISRADIQKKPEPKKEDIIKPRIEIVAPINRGINTKGIPLHYIRLTAELNLPKGDRYELNQVDCTFLHTNQNKYLFGGKKVLTVDLLQKCFVELQLMTGKDSSTIPKSLKPKFKTWLEGQLDVMAKMQKLDQFVDAIYNFWRSRRDQLKNPLLRQLWRPNIDDTSHYLAFRPREKDKQKRHLRRINKSNQDDTKMHIENLIKEVVKSRELVERVVARENLKLAMFNLDLQKFNVEAKPFKDEPLFVPEFSKKQITKLRQDYKHLKDQYESHKEAQQMEIANNITQSSVVAEDSKTAIANFIANLSTLANQVGINVDTLDNNQRSTFQTCPVPKQDSMIAPAVSNSVCRFNIKQIRNKEQRFLCRNFSPLLGEAKGERIEDESNPFFVMRHRSVCRNYFFQEDEEEAKDVKRSISVNFKKYLASRIS